MQFPTAFDEKSDLLTLNSFSRVVLNNRTELIQINIQRNYNKRKIENEL